MTQGIKKRARGRPVIYQGDPDAPGLDPAERRLLQRRISNRESARRTRHRREEHVASLYAKVCTCMDAPNAASRRTIMLSCQSYELYKRHESQARTPLTRPILLRLAHATCSKSSCVGDRPLGLPGACDQGPTVSRFCSCDQYRAYV